ncbi:hypothetical protein QBC46DRAFT_389715 [Diplogelasinospora grovesii]|uniref:Steroid 5-alpha reductase C-terminal domain-containing protein n=1 Tax=Diplogelasinospora grovesii TaxID=303347 RepID=A0AAN6N3P9_9PEZI|nr:hypothetical protein QBC46DRAFT_389715 [Diplogelasinospora grovesii]
MSLIQSLLHITDFRGGPFAANLVPAASSALAVQLAFGIPSVLAHTDMFYDFSGGWTFLLTLASSFFLPALRSSSSSSSSGISLADFSWRQLAMTGGVLVYAVRLSSFLFMRILKKGHDSRFDETKHKPSRFFIFWIAQAVWVIMCCMPIIAINAVPQAALKAIPSVLPTDVLGLGLFLAGFAVEIVADSQKSKWYDEKIKKIHDEQFITRGIWSKSRYPNYFGDITLWIGMATAAAGVLTSGPVQVALGWSGISGLIKGALLPYMAPAFVAWALLRISGVPLSEAKYDKLFGDRKDYREWRNNTPLLVPRIF